jgi:hypothetical protein
MTFHKRSIRRLAVATPRTEGHPQFRHVQLIAFAALVVVWPTGSDRRAPAGMARSRGGAFLVLSFDRGLSSPLGSPRCSRSSRSAR